MSANLRTKYAAIVIAHIVTVLYLLFTLIKTKLKEQTNERFGLGINQLISKCPFGVFKSFKKPTNFFQDFCQSLKKDVISKK